MANNTPFDDTYKTLIEKFPSLIVPLVNEQFGRNYSDDVTVEILSQELQKKEGDIAADSIFKICDNVYHIECQSNPDGTIAVRMLEYDFYIAMRNIVTGNTGELSIDFPKSCVLYLRHNSKTPKKVKIRVNISEKKHFYYEVPIIKTQRYSLKEIFNKKLYLLLPFYILRYENDKEKINKNPQKLEKVVEEYKEIISKLDNTKDLTDLLLVAEIEQQMKDLVGYMFDKQKNAKNRIGGAIMGGTVMQTIGERIQELEKKVEDTVKEKDNTIKEKDNTIKEKDNTIKNKDIENCILRKIMNGKNVDEIAAEENMTVEEVNKILNK